MQSERSIMRRPPKNDLNDLPPKEWVQATKSVWYSRPGARDKLKKLHPATFAEKDVERLILCFTKKGDKVLDPFLGTGSTLVACAAAQRNGVGIELIPRWAGVARDRIRAKLADEGSRLELIEGDAGDELPKLEDASFDLVVTSPPYFCILDKAKDHKSKAERKGLSTKYSDDARDLGNLSSYAEFLAVLTGIWKECRRVLKPGKYICVVVTDFRDGPRYVLFHADVARTLEDAGFVPKGLVVLVQDNKALYPYGYPYSFVPNIHHQNVLVFRKEP
jgi:DNA modification methylase